MKVLSFWPLLTFFALTMIFSIDTVHSQQENHQKGQSLYQNCISCHGDRGQGQPEEKKAKKAPKLAGQFSWYIVSSIKAFQEGKKRSHPAPKLFRKLKNDDIEALAAYIAGLKPHSIRSTE